MRFAEKSIARRHWLAWLSATVIAPALFLMLMALLDRPAAIDPAYRVSSALYLDHIGLDPPSDRVKSAAVAVPHELPASTQGVLSSWYLIEPTSAQRASGRMAMYAPEPSGNLLLYVDGVKVAGYARMTYPPSHHAFPLLLSLPEDDLTTAGSHLLVQSVRDGLLRRLPEIYLGPSAVLEPAQERRWWLQAGVVRIAMLLACCLALLAMGFYALRPADRAYAWFAAALIFWVAHISRDFVIDIPVSRPVWTACGNVALGAFVYCAIVFVHRYVDSQPHHRERMMAAVLGLSAVLLIMVATQFGWRYYGLAARLWVPLVNAGGLYLVWTLIHAARRVPQGDRFALLAVATTTAAVGVRDFLYDFDLLSVGSMFYLGHALLLVVLVFGAIVVRRFARAVSEVERLNQELDRRVASKSLELDANHARVRELEREQARRRERERIVREVHDGIGGQLVQGLAIAERGTDVGALREVIEACWTELRMMVDAVDAGDADIVNLLARFRHRVGRRLDAAGVELEWHGSNLPPRTLRGNDAINVLRILQEAFANALRHGGGNKLSVDTGIEADGSLWIEVRDNGGGIGEHSRGHGIDGMRARAAQIGGTLSIAGDAGGSTVRLRLPAASPH